MALLAPTSYLMDYENAERRRHPAIFGEAPSSAQLGPPLLARIYRDQLLDARTRSHYIELEQSFISLRDQLSALRSVKPGWDGYHAPAPNETTLAAAEAALNTFRSLNARPTAVLPSADGGVGICFTHNERYAHIEFENSGDAWALMYGSAGAPESWKLPSNDIESIRAAWTRISAYLQS